MSRYERVVQAFLEELCRHRERMTGDGDLRSVQITVLISHDDVREVLASLQSKRVLKTHPGRSPQGAVMGGVKN